MAGEIKPGDRVRVVLDVLEVLSEDTPLNDPYYKGVYAAAGSLRLGYANEPGDDSITTSADLVTLVPPMVTLSPEQWTEIVEAVESGDSWTTSGIHLNYGDSDAYMEMWNAGHDAAGRGAPCVVPDELLANLPERTRERVGSMCRFRGAHRPSAYAERTAAAHSADLADTPPGMGAPGHWVC